MRSIPLAIRHRKSGGFTLIELMVAMVVSSIVVLGIFAFATIQQTTSAAHQRHVRVQQALEGAMWSMGQDVRMAGMGFARLCTELRVWDEDHVRLINPGGATSPADAAVDPHTGNAYWVLRDGLQADWNSDNADDIEAAVDRLDVLFADPILSETAGVFVLADALTTTSTVVTMRTGLALDNGNPDHLAEVQQMFPPGSFIAVTRAASAVPVRPEGQGQCMLLQVTGSVLAHAGDAQLWDVPIAELSGFNAGLDVGMLANNNGDLAELDDWRPLAPDDDNTIGATVVPLGHVRWSRYEVDYTVPNRPYLVRYDLIAAQATDPQVSGAVDYPDCGGRTCVLPQLHLFDSNTPPEAIAVGPMIEDLQVAVGCDGYTEGSLGHEAPEEDWAPPEPGFAEDVGGHEPNRRIDESPVGDGRDTDEWLGNARGEQTAPDCVYYGTGQYQRGGWAIEEGNQDPPPLFRMSPQLVRVTLVGSSENPEQAGGIQSDQLPAIEDRPEMDSQVGVRHRFSLSETFTPINLRWRDPQVL